MGEVPVMRDRMTPSTRALMLCIAAMAFTAVAGSNAFAQAGHQVSPLAAMRQPQETGMVGWIIVQQSAFYRELSALIRAAKDDGTAFWGLVGVSFLYGIFHAAGPGHGKAVISSYLVANEETWRRGIALSFASAMLQAVTAVVLVAVAAVLLGATAKMMGDTVRVIELVSYALIVLVGLRLLWVKGRGFLRSLQQAKAKAAAPIAPAHHHNHVHHDHAHHHDHEHHEHAHSDHHHHHHGNDRDHEDDVLPWGHAHGPEPEELAGPGGWRRGLSAIVAVGLRPCSGAIIVLVFALAQGLFWAGVVSTFVMGLGTAITVAAIATLAVGARVAAKQFAASRAGYGLVLLRGVEVGAAVVVTMFGVLLLTGTIASERMGMF
jgi:nickel/cobalt transporter (NicO) family protein